jgi:hypothetical protein
MKVIQPNCRNQFTAADIDFIVSVLGKTSSESLLKLFSDPDSLDMILDEEALLKALLEQSGFIHVSRHFYFYVLVRHVLKRSGIDHRMLADYVAAMLVEFSLQERFRRPLNGEGEPMDYLVDMLAALNAADDMKRFLIRAHVGNHSLFVSGVFPERIHYRAQFRGAPEITYYESLGSSNFRVASDHRLAHRFDLSAVFTLLSEHFHDIRLALNDMTDRLLFLGDKDFAPILNTQIPPANGSGHGLNRD